MSLPADERILEVLSYGLILTPKTVAINADMSRVHANRRLKELTEYGLVDKVERGKYEISDLGNEYLEGNIDANDLGTGNS